MTAPVPRETPPAPPAASGVFGSRLALAEHYVHLLSTAGIERGLLGPREMPRLWDRHVLNCAVITDLVPTDATVVDIGSGAGLPGIAMAIRRPDLHIDLVEPLLRRTALLEEVVAELGLSRVRVRRNRAEEVAGDATYDVVTSRAVAPLDQLLRWSLPLAATDGEVLAIKGRAAREEIEALGLPGGARELVSIQEVGSDQLVVPTTVVRVDSALGRHIAWNRSRGGPPLRRRGSSQRRRHRT